MGVENEWPSGAEFSHLLSGFAWPVDFLDRDGSMDVSIFYALQLIAFATE